MLAPARLKDSSLTSQVRKRLPSAKPEADSSFRLVGSLRTCMQMYPRSQCISSEGCDICRDYGIPGEAPQSLWPWGLCNRGHESWADPTAGLCASPGAGPPIVDMSVDQDTNAAGTVEYRVKHPNHCGLEVSATGAMGPGADPCAGLSTASPQFRTGVGYGGHPAGGAAAGYPGNVPWLNPPSYYQLCTSQVSITAFAGIRTWAGRACLCAGLCALPPGSAVLSSAHEAHERLCCAAPSYTRQGWRWDIPEEDMALAAVSPTLSSLTHRKHSGQGLLLTWCQL
jgi:hypothetical protein